MIGGLIIALYHGLDMNTTLDREGIPVVYAAASSTSS